MLRMYPNMPMGEKTPYGQAAMGHSPDMPTLSPFCEGLGMGRANGWLAGSTSRRELLVGSLFLIINYGL